MCENENQYLDIKQLTPLRELAKRVAESNQGIIDCLDNFINKQSMRNRNRLINLDED